MLGWQQSDITWMIIDNLAIHDYLCFSLGDGCLTIEIVDVDFVILMWVVVVRRFENWICLGVVAFDIIWTPICVLVYLC